MTYDHEWLVCDRCAEPQMLRPEKIGRECHMTPKCEGVVRRPAGGPLRWPSEPAPVVDPVRLFGSMPGGVIDPIAVHYKDVKENAGSTAQTVPRRDQPNRYDREDQ